MDRIGLFRCRSSSPSLSSLGSIPMADHISAQYSHVRIHDVLPKFSETPSTTYLIAAVQEALSFINLFLSDAITNAPAFFASQLNGMDAQERARLHDLAMEAAVELSEWLEKCERRDINSVSCKSLFSAMGVEHTIKKAPQRIYLRFRMEPALATLIHSYVTKICDRMIGAARNAPHAITADGRIILIGARDWGGLTMYEQMQVVLATKRYQNWIMAAAARRQNSGTLASLGHSHAPSLTARQERRSGVEQAELREKWGMA
ncbi:hypothetical protein BCR35DRAFT_313594 [Leucosporidium creatinivorum]|uniref:Uncharacterized protein n=1 Tax=Leucosporidium creatinivorum TaxID=106004 RepID=A0A1Y2FHT2_9BASI|nr:hypothetical protein BCR35DRAFT_313594 [Leucosporidium creatinivorum]